MKSNCVACHAEFRIDPDRINVNGSMVRCLKCGYIFMVYPPDFYGSPVIQDTNIEQAILDELLEMQDQSVDRISGQKLSDECHLAVVDTINPIQNNGEDLHSEDAEYAELPDLSELEKMIDWDDDDIDEKNDLEASPVKSNYNPNDTQELDINRI